MAINAQQSVAIDSRSVAFGNGDNTEIDLGAKSEELLLKTTASVRLGFDTPANADDFLLEVLDRVVRVKGECTRLYARGESGTGTLYIIVVR